MSNVSRLVSIALFALAALFGLYAFTLSRAAPVPRAPLAVTPAAPALAVIVAARDIAPGHAIGGDDLAVRMEASMPAGAFDTAAPLIGRVPVAGIAQGGVLTEGAFASGLAASILAGERAVAVRVDESNAVSNLVKTGDAVDVFVVMKRDAGADGEIPASHARLLLSKVRVLNFGDGANPGQASVARTAVLAVRVDDIDALTLAENNGRLMLALRNPADPDIHHAETARAATGVSLATLAGGSAKAAPVPSSSLAGMPMLPPLPATLAATNGTRRIAAGVAGGVEVIRGARRDNVQNY